MGYFTSAHSAVEGTDTFAVPSASLGLEGDGGCVFFSLWNYGQRRLRRRILLSERRLRRRHLLPGFSRPQPGQADGQVPPDTGCRNRGGGCPVEKLLGRSEAQNFAEKILSRFRTPPPIYFCNPASTKLPEKTQDFR